MRKKEKLIGALVILLIALIFLVVGYFNSKPKEITESEMEKMFVEDNTVNKEGKNISKNNNEKDKGNKSNGENENNNENIEENSKNNIKKIVVEIRGEVKKPDVYYIEEGRVVNDLINMAGGLTEKADIININRAKKLNNHELIFVQSKEEVAAGVNMPNINNTSNLTNESENKSNISSENNHSIININTASKEELMTLPSVGEKTAEKIIQYREENGNFKNIEDIKNVDRIGDKTFEKFKDKITI